MGAVAPAVDGGSGEPADRAWSRPAPGPRALGADVAAGLLAAAVCVLELELTRAVSTVSLPSAAGRAEQVVWTALVALALCARRRLPATAMLLSAAAFITLGSRSPLSAATFSLNVALFLVLLSGTAWARDRRRVAVTWVVVLAAMVAWYLASLAGVVSQGLPPSSAGLVALTALINVVYFSGALLGGRALWRAARDRDALRRTAEQLRAEQEVTARAAVVAERLRIARELHDVVAHHVSTTGVQAAAARRVLERAPDGGAGAAASRTRVADALRQVEASSRAAVGEMRGLLGVLRAPEDQDGSTGRADARARLEGPGAPRGPEPGVEDLPRVVEEVRDRGLDVSLAVVGEPRSLPGTTATSVVRLVQEALVNVERHSTAGSARVVLRWLDEGGRGVGPAVEAEVVDDGPARRGGGSTGLGHRGMRERAALVGGEVETGARPGGGYRVRGRYPVDPAAPADDHRPVVARDPATTAGRSA
ncbi:sensor histidine kinase [uncultured Pseudokineococcus sp.]|uniref:sensor histidine kinase n=1 Tax=uncultured Pseudokineococcus sp. TaxID=1642928 RepID=UPI00262853FD|nr:histidine kinase [uncultured Pseudokineococcus sp.]